jgi:hypothetical protein
LLSFANGRFREFAEKPTQKSQPGCEVQEPGGAGGEAGGGRGVGLMTKQKLPAALEGVSRPVKHADTVEKIVAAVGFGIADAFMPGAGVARSLVEIYQAKQKQELEKILIEEVSKGNLPDLSDERLESLIPMAFRLAQAKKQGEYEEVLRILAAFIRGELEQEIPNPSNFASMARRVEGLSPTDLKVMSLIEAFIRDVKARNDPRPVEQPFVSATALGESVRNRHQLSTRQIQEALVDLASRGFLLADGATRSGKAEEFYFPTNSFNALIARAMQSESGTHV